MDGSQTPKLMNVFFSKIIIFLLYSTVVLVPRALTQVDLCELWSLRGRAVFVEGIDDLLLGLSDAVTVEHLDGDVISTLWLHHALHWLHRDQEKQNKVENYSNIIHQ